MNKSSPIFENLFISLVIVLLTLGCAQKKNPIDNGSVEVPTATQLITNQTITPWWVNESTPYPISSETFDLTAKILSGSDADVKIKGISEEVASEYLALRSWYIQMGIKEENLDPLYYNGSNGIHWDLAAKANDGNFLLFTLTSGPEKGQLVRSVGLVAYLYSKPSFTVSELTNPTDNPSAIQKVIWDRSGWNIIGAFNGENLTDWHDNETAGGVWRLLPNAATATPEATVTPTEKVAASEVWQLSPDGHIAYKESELYGGLFTINKEHPEFVEKYWDDTIRGLWNVNYVANNTGFTSQFPTADSLIKYLKDGGGPVSNLWIPVIYPNERQQYWGQATMVPVEGRIDLSQIAISIYKPTKDEIYKYSESYATGTKFICFRGAHGEAFVEKIDINNKNILHFTYRKDMLMDATYLNADRKSETSLALTGDKTPEENLQAALQLLRVWNYSLQDIVNLATTGRGWLDELSPPMLNIILFRPNADEYKAMTDVAGSPLSVR